MIPAADTRPAAASRPGGQAAGRPGVSALADAPVPVRVFYEITPEFPEVTAGASAYAARPSHSASSRCRCRLNNMWPMRSRR